ncbi:lysophospholipid acyltransferase family protein [Porphyromonas sp.]|uniref:lysophospholipid acyltransferase family protein n=1 Tax=Porphyromonas sp. TaxID=1924944 RepID=UPI0026DB3C29|nr:lysophospholipid acyltransferase family protein [Porphyromonas sp.]MDO4695215.1 lysophospholipid acyltransferase family protein [Porphyromonas sp.]MDO4770985.1 lysophospholipid acyltransferase family protein [Porphyromonas sp.]
MKNKEVISVEDLSNILGPFFKSRMGRVLGKRLLKTLKIDKINAIHRTYYHLRGGKFTSAALEHPFIQVSYRIHGEEKIEQMKKSGAFIAVANHPFGGLDGLMLIDVVGKARPDFKVVANRFLTYIKALEDSFIPVVPRQNKSSYNHNATENVNSIKMISAHIKEGKPIGIFPAGGIANSKFGQEKGNEQLWQMSSIRMVRSAEVPVYPIYFEGENSKAYYYLNRISYMLSVLKIPSELFNKKGKEIGVYIGDPILPEEIQRYKNNSDLRDFLMDKTLNLPSKYNEQ